MRIIKTLLISLGLVLLGGVAFAQNTTVKGVVSDANGDPIPGVAVVAKSSSQTIGQVTDVNGNYSISVPASVKALTFSILGYEDLTATVSGSTLNVTL